MLKFVEDFGEFSWKCGAGAWVEEGLAEVGGGGRKDGGLVRRCGVEFSRMLS